MNGMRNGFTRKIIAWFIAFAMALTFGVMDISVVSAVEGQQQSEKGTKAEELQHGQYKDGEVLVMYNDAKKLNKKDALQLMESGEAAKSDIEDFAVKEIWSFELAEDSEADEGMQLQGLGESKDEYVNVALLDTGDKSVEEAIEILKNNDNIECAEPNFRIHAADVSATDPYVDRQWGLDDVNVDKIWDKTKDTDYAVVAVVDTGVDYNHEDLKDNIWTNPYINKGLKGEHGFNFITGSKEPMDDNGHGTHCAGIIGAAGNNDVGICGITGSDGNDGTRNNIDIMALKILDEGGSGYGSEEIAAYNYINRAMQLGVNVVAINNSYGGGAYSEIMERLITVTGENGAISVIAAGNDGVDIDQYYEEDEEHYYPVEYESDYKIVVAATKPNASSGEKSDELVSFSNYNSEKVDMAAPGTDILSTVCYDCYNPELYSSDSRINNETFKNGIEPEDFECSEGVSVEIGDGINGPDTGIKFTIDCGDSDIYAACIDYTLDKADFEEPPYCSMVMRADKAPAGGFFGAGYFEIFDTSTAVSLENLTVEEANTHNMAYEGIAGSSDYWTHLSAKCCADTAGETESDLTEGQTRRLWIVLEEPEGNHFEICTDNIGVSNADKKSSFGKYDYYSGTSMAAPQVTGATALISTKIQKENGDETDYLDVVGEVTSSVRPSEKMKNLTATEGTLDFYSSIAGKALKISRVDAGNETITINGTGFKKFDSLEVKIGGETVNSELYTFSNNEIEIDDSDNKWINDLVDVEVTGTSGNYHKTAKKKNVYLVNGKDCFDEGDVVEKSTTSLATDGKYLYTSCSAEDSIFRMNPASGIEQKRVCRISDSNLESWFENYYDEEEELCDYDFTFEDGLVYINGKLFTLASYAEIGDNVTASEDDFWSQAIVESDEEDDIDSREKDQFEYFKETTLLRIDPEKKKAAKVELPEELKDVVDYTMAAYNGKLYFIGGFRYEVDEDGPKPVLTGTFNRDVYIYSPDTSKWAETENALPADRAGGSVIQTGNNLVYTLGYGQNPLINMVYDGTEWVESAAELEPYVSGEKVTRCGEDYEWYRCGIGICRDGIVYAGFNVKDYGDTFIYSVSDDQYQDTGYNLNTFIPEETDSRSIAIGKMVYCLTSDGDEDTMFGAEAISSGLMKVKTSKSGKGSITSTRYYVPGSTAKVKVKAKNGYRILKIRTGGKTKKYSRNTRTKTITVSKALVKNVEVKTFFKKR